MQAPQGRVPPLQEAPAQTVSTVRKATEADYWQLISTLARAYYDDPVYCWYFPDDSRRLQQLYDVFVLFGAKALFQFEETYVVDGVGGGALWVPPERWRMCPFTRTAAVRGLASKLGLRDMVRPLRGLYLLQSRHRPDPPHYYLALVGVEPGSQGEGVGKALLQPVLSRCDREGLPAYLEATTPRARAFGERNGFVVIGQIGLRRGPTIWPMWRRPR